MYIVGRQMGQLLFTQIGATGELNNQTMEAHQLQTKTALKLRNKMVSPSGMIKIVQYQLDSFVKLEIFVEIYLIGIQ
jgi:hypothetical protein